MGGLAKRGFCFLATHDPRRGAHAVGVAYVTHDGAIYVNTVGSSRKVRNIDACPQVSVCVPVRRVPIGAPPATVQFAGRADVIDIDDSAVRHGIDEGRFDRITSHGELDLPGSCFLRITPIGRLNTYGLGMSLRALARDPLHAAGYAHAEASAS